MKGIEIRAALIKDAPVAGELIRASLYGFATYLVGLGDDHRAAEVLGDYFRLPGNRYSYQVSYAALADKRVVGLLVAFSGKDLIKLNLWTMLQMSRVYSLSEIIKFIKRVLILRDEEEVGKDEFYVANLAVDPFHRGQGIGRALLEFSEELAFKKGLPKLSLLAETENVGAISLYEKFGFKIVKTYNHPHQMALTGSPAYVRMVKGLQN